MRRKQVTFMTVNANHATNKMASIIHTIYARNYDVVHITEAGLGKKLPDTIKGYRAIKLDHISPNRGSIMYVKNEYYDKMVRIKDPDDKKIVSEIIHILINTLPPTNIIGVYQETGITNYEADEAHKVLENKVTK